MRSLYSGDQINKSILVASMLTLFLTACRTQQAAPAPADPPPPAVRIIYAPMVEITFNAFAEVADVTSADDNTPAIVAVEKTPSDSTEAEDTSTGEDTGDGESADVEAIPTKIPLLTLNEQPGDVAGAERAIFDLINQYRANAGVASVAWDDTLAQISRSRANDMIARDYLSHNDPVTKVHLGHQMVSEAGYSASDENFFMSFGAGPGDFPGQSMDWLINDPPHAVIILSPQFTHVGVGIGISGNQWILIQNFALP